MGLKTKQKPVIILLTIIILLFFTFGVFAEHKTEKTATKSVSDEVSIYKSEKTEQNTATLMNNKVIEEPENKEKTCENNYNPNAVDPAYSSNTIKIYPSGAAPTTVASAASSWGWGSWTQIVPASTITNDFIITGITVSSQSSARTDYQIQIGKGGSGSETEIANSAGRHSDGSKASTTTGGFPFPVKVDANTRIAARITDDDASNRNYYVRIHYMELPLTII